MLDDAQAAQNILTEVQQISMTDQDRATLNEIFERVHDLEMALPMS